MILLRSANGATRPAVILVLTGAIMRVALQDSGELEEYRLVNQTWISGHCEPVTFEFPLGIFEAIGMMPPRPGFPTGN